jgi:hypothetical protein
MHLPSHLKTGPLWHFRGEARSAEEIETLEHLERLEPEDPTLPLHSLLGSITLGISQGAARLVHAARVLVPGRAEKPTGLSRAMSEDSEL